MGKYCCFSCPSTDYAEKSLKDHCPTCDRPYDFALEHLPSTIREYTILRHLGRGFYGAAYVAESGPFKKKSVIKISPASFYEFAPFKKTPFETETELHHRIATNAEHVVGIDDRFDMVVQFSDPRQTSIACHVAVLEFVDGVLLRDYLDAKVPVDIKLVSQIAIDLLRIRGEFEANELNHNDLHAENLIVERLSKQARRVDAIEDTIKVMAIDLGSISGESKSGGARHGDLLHIANHVDQLLKLLLKSPDNLDDRDYRTTLALQGVVNSLQSSAQNIRQANYNDLVNQVRDTYERASQPWKPWIEPVRLRGFSDHYNAQTMVSWFVPRLLVDPQASWVNDVTSPGPQIITGMRGCGKTMLLRALDIHARASLSEGEVPAAALKRVESDAFVGLFVSAQRLLDVRQPVARIEHRLTRLLAYYALEAARALMHLRDLDPSAVVSNAHTILGGAVADYLQGADDLRAALSIDDLEAKLLRLAVMSATPDESRLVRQAPAEVFPHFAQQLKRCSPVWKNARILFLLDDVSTRYLDVDRIEELLSALLFQDPNCAFKFTSEWQTIVLGLQSPGRNHPVRIDRDVAIFDLGANVHSIINTKGKGATFVAQILHQRALLHGSNATGTPVEILGDVSLEQVAREIAKSNKTSKERKKVYRGLSCLTNVCVGDIGDVIKLYEEITKTIPADSAARKFPVSASIQTECFLNLSSRRIYDLDRRAGLYKVHALQFASAAHAALVESHKEPKKGNPKAPRLRQYSSIYVRVTSDDELRTQRQIDLLRELIDAGVFVYAGGAARTKTKDSNPLQQFKIGYRKIYGLASYIGLADRDRFELSGDDLEKWLTQPSEEILLSKRSLAADEDGGSDDFDEVVSAEGAGDYATTIPSQVGLFDPPAQVQSSEAALVVAPSPIDVRVTTLSAPDLASIRIGGVLAGLGFEERTLESNRIFSRYAAPDAVHLIRYEEPGHAREIELIWRSACKLVAVHPYSPLPTALPRIDGIGFIDVSGLSKPIIFGAVRRELLEKGRVLVGHVAAQRHYPLQEDLRDLFDAENASDAIRILESLGSVLKGEIGPYSEVRMLDEDVDQSRRRALIAFASAKHERLFSLLDRREYDYIRVLAPSGDSPRSRVARYAADFLCKDYQSADVATIDPADLPGIVRYLDEAYLELYALCGANVEFGLTGTKMEAVGSAILSARRKVAQAWYVKPSRFDADRFSSGVGDVKVYDIQVGR